VAETSSQTVQIQACLDRLRGGDEAAGAELLDRACERLRNLARKMLKGYPNVRRWEQTDDVLQNAALRLHRTLRQLTVQTPGDFFRLAAVNIRRELLDLAKHYYGPQGRGARHATWGAGDPTASGEAGPADPGDLSGEPSRRPGASSTSGSAPCPTRNARSSTCSGIRASARPRPPSCSGCPSAPSSAAGRRPG
jgi:ECF sigma factor